MANEQIKNNLDIWYKDVGGEFFSSEEKINRKERTCCFCNLEIPIGDKFRYEYLFQKSFVNKNKTMAWDFHLDCYEKAMKILLHKGEYL